MESKLARIVKTFTFRLALVYVGLFSLSVILLFTFIYTYETNHLEAQVSDAIRMQYTYLADEYRRNGTPGVEARMKELIADDDEGSGIFMLVNQKGEKLAGNLNEWPVRAPHETPFEKIGWWTRFHIEGLHNNSQSIAVRAVMIPLSRWRSLLVGQTLLGSERVEQTIVQTFWASLMLTLAMAFFGALIMTRSVMRRLSVINHSAETIMHGDLGARVPFTQGGDEFDDLSSNLNQMLDKIETLLESISQFSTNIAHDLRSPLNRIISRLDASLRHLERDNPARGLLEKNIHELQELVATFNSILKISELEANTEFRTFSACDLREIIGGLVELYEPYALEKKIALHNAVSENAVIDGEKNLLTQAVANLLDNALKFTPEGGKVTIACEKSAGATDLIITDSGPGIPSAFKGKVFEKFFRLEQSRHTRGNGLGLSLVAAIARIHNAAITLDDNHPGLVVRVSFPQADA
ncbi:MAG: HAMP domain-containing protein [Pseudomonadota bacterium]|nr:HAMP domain-containing protein [Pseudomonadota bacterium]MDE3036836.1 HAMP domain-containing protein [Pseudomonadota bacterium]